LSKYDELYSKEGSFKETWDGKIATIYKVPKYIQVFIDTFQHKEPMDVLELGAGNGEVSEQIIKQNPKFIKRYVTTDLSKVGVEKLIEKGFESYQVDAQDLARFDDNSFDLVFCIDVMHHVEKPRQMAQEMLRVSKKYIFLIEANGLCVLRKLHELMPSQKAVGEKSYTPWGYLSFFKSNKLKEISIKPFLFMVPFTPAIFIKPMILLSEILEKLPLIKWQGSGVVIKGEVGG